MLGSARVLSVFKGLGVCLPVGKKDNDLLKKAIHSS